MPGLIEEEELRLDRRLLRAADLVAVFSVAVFGLAVFTNPTLIGGVTVGVTIALVLAARRLLRSMSVRTSWDGLHLHNGVRASTIPWDRIQGAWAQEDRASWPAAYVLVAPQEVVRLPVDHADAAAMVQTAATTTGAPVMASASLPDEVGARRTAFLRARPWWRCLLWPIHDVPMHWNPRS